MPSAHNPAARFGLSDSDLARLWEIMEEAFPPEERRTRKGFARILRDPALCLTVHRDAAGLPAAFLIGWELEGFRYVEHFAVSASLRGQGKGGRMLADFLSAAPAPIVLEVEPPETDTARRRVAFYERLGFCLNPYPYEQPPLQPTTSAIPLMVMSWPAPLSEEDFGRVREELYRRVYRVGQPAL